MQKQPGHVMIMESLESARTGLELRLRCLNCVTLHTRVQGGGRGVRLAGKWPRAAPSTQQMLAEWDSCRRFVRARRQDTGVGGLLEV